MAHLSTVACYEKKWDLSRGGHGIREKNWKRWADGIAHDNCFILLELRVFNLKKQKSLETKHMAIFHRAVGRQDFEDFITAGWWQDGPVGEPGGGPYIVSRLRSVHVSVMIASTRSRSLLLWNVTPCRGVLIYKAQARGHGVYHCYDEILPLVVPPPLTQTPLLWHVLALSTLSVLARSGKKMKGKWGKCEMPQP